MPLGKGNGPGLAILQPFLSQKPRSLRGTKRSSAREAPTLALWSLVNTKLSGPTAAARLGVLICSLT